MQAIIAVIYCIKEINLEIFNVNEKQKNRIVVGKGYFISRFSKRLSDCLFDKI
jgi:hypothetical protein